MNEVDRRFLYGNGYIIFVMVRFFKRWNRVDVLLSGFRMCFIIIEGLLKKDWWGVFEDGIVLGYFFNRVFVYGCFWCVRWVEIGVFFVIIFLVYYCVNLYRMLVVMWYIFCFCVVWLMNNGLWLCFGLYYLRFCWFFDFFILKFIFKVFFVREWW